jgi:hypothetical protein
MIVIQPNKSSSSFQNMIAICPFSMNEEEISAMISIHVAVLHTALQKGYCISYWLRNAAESSYYDIPGGE